MNGITIARMNAQTIIGSLLEMLATMGKPQASLEIEIGRMERRHIMKPLGKLEVVALREGLAKGSR